MTAYAVVSPDGTIDHVYHEDGIEALAHKLAVDFPKHTRLTFDGDLAIAAAEGYGRKENPAPAGLKGKMKQVQGLLDSIVREGGAVDPATGVPRIDRRIVDRMSLEEAHEQLVPYFRADTYDDVLDFALNLLSQNTKLTKGSEGLTIKGRTIPTGRAVGLSIFPHAEYLKQLPALNDARAGAFEEKLAAIQAKNEELVALGKKPKALPEPGSKILRLPRVAMGETLGVCAGSTPECRIICLAYSGKNPLDQPINAKAERTAALFERPHAFCRMLVQAIDVQRCLTRTMGLERFYVRLNVYSDIPWEYLYPELFGIWSKEDVTFYDYTKHGADIRDPKDGPLDLTHSYTAQNKRLADEWFKKGGRYAVVFLGGKGVKIKDVDLESLTFQGHPVVEGKAHDFRPLDPKPAVVGLKWIEPGNRGLKATDETSEKERVSIEDELKKRASARDRFVVMVDVSKEGLITTPYTPSMTSRT